jgi:peptidoglycan/xylan/chitin deacetylase (PgdA/CDA1 family)
MSESIKPILRFISSWDDGRADDVRLAALLLKYNLPGIFFIPDCAELSDEQIVQLAEHFEIGGHTVSHPQDLKLLKFDELRHEIEDNRFNLRDLTGQQVYGFCYPRGRYDDKVIAAVKLAGYQWARGTVILNNKDYGPYRINGTIHAGCPRPEYGEVSWYDRALFEAGHAARTGSVFHVWGHSWEVSKYREWDNLENLFKYLTDHFTIQYENLLAKQ